VLEHVVWENLVSNVDDLAEHTPAGTVAIEPSKIPADAAE
jgi:hypothetical protein